jgi:hypothetical protein
MHRCEYCQEFYASVRALRAHKPKCRRRLKVVRDRRVEVFAAARKRQRRGDGELLLGGKGSQGQPPFTLSMGTSVQTMIQMKLEKRRSRHSLKQQRARCTLPTTWRFMTVSQ